MTLLGILMTMSDKNLFSIDDAFEQLSPALLPDQPANESIFGIPLDRLLTVNGTLQPPELVYRKILPAGHKALMPEEAWVRREA